MAVELDDGEFWLPSQFLTEEDILMDFEGPHKLSHKGSSSSLSTESVSPLEYSFTGGGGSTEAESDEEDFLAGLSRRISWSSLQDSGSLHNPKGLVLPRSPQSTLSPVGVRAGGGSSDGWGCGSSRGSPTGPVSPPSTAAKGELYRSNDVAALDLLNAAAGEVARMKLLQNHGTGYFDSSRGVLPQRNQGNSHSSSVSPLPAPLKKKNSSNGHHQAARRPHFHGGAVFPQNDHLFRAQFQARQFQQLRNQQTMTQQSNNKGIVWSPSRPVSGQFQSADNSRVARHMRRDNGGDEVFNGSGTSNTHPLGLSPSAWPPLHRNQDRPAPSPPPGAAGMRAVFLGEAGAKRECAGTGVFLPRRVSGRCGAPNESRKNSNKPACSTALLPEKVVQALDNINHVQSQRLVRSQSQNNGGGTQAQRSSSDNGRSPANVEIQLPSEWTY